MTEIFPTCLGCGERLTRTFIDLGFSPLANRYAKPGDTSLANQKYPLHARVCDACLLVQVDQVVTPEDIFSDYAYFSSFSDSWLAHCRSYAAAMIRRFDLNAQSRVIELGSNDGYMLQYFRDAGISVLGIDPAANIADRARARGVPTEVAFFGVETARRLIVRGDMADFLVAKNVLAHVPDINDFVAGLAVLLKPEAVFSVEFPHLLNMIRQVQFDTIYHEHFTYLSILAVERIFSRWGLRIFEIEEIPTHGGSLHVMGCHAAASHQTTDSVKLIRDKEMAANLDRPEGYASFKSRVLKVKSDLLAFLSEVKSRGKTIVGYGAAAKGNTLLNYCGIGPDIVAFVADRNPAKQSRLLPGSMIEVKPPEAIFEARPDYALILPWNLRAEIESQLAGIRAWGGRFVTAIPEIRIN